VIDLADSSEVSRLWSDYKATGDKELRDRLVIRYSPLVKYVGGRVAAGLAQHVDSNDLVSSGIFGLLDAIDKFDPERGYKFETYAIARIKGAILDELRATDWVPRSVRAKARAVEQAYQKLENSLRRTPTDDELARELELSEEQLQATLGQISLVGLVALDETLSAGDRADSTTVGDALADAQPGPLALVEIEETKRILSTCINGLPERERFVLSLYYYEGLTLAEIGQILRVTESRVCQIHTKAVLHLRARLAATDRDSS
jgi:RNA polymerase sigma factor for flagellar operon FliA